MKWMTMALQMPEEERRRQHRRLALLSCWERLLKFLRGACQAIRIRDSCSHLTPSLLIVDALRVRSITNDERGVIWSAGPFLLHPGSRRMPRHPFARIVVVWPQALAGILFDEHENVLVFSLGQGQMGEEGDFGAVRPGVRHGRPVDAIADCVEMM